MTRTLQRLVREFEQLPDVAGGMCFDVRGPFRTSMTFAPRVSTSLRESVEAAADGLAVQVPRPEPAESVSADEATARLQALLARHAATAETVRPLAQIMIGNVCSTAEKLACAGIPGDAGEGLVILGMDHTWTVWMHADPALPLLGRKPPEP